MWPLAQAAAPGVGGVEAVVGVGLFGLLALAARLIATRTKDIDERNDASTKAFMAAAFEREARMAAERDAALAEARALHLKVALDRVTCEKEKAELRTEYEVRLRNLRGNQHD